MIVLDTNVASELMRSVPAGAVVEWVLAHQPAHQYTTSITVAEIGHGIERLADGQRKEGLRRAAHDVFEAFGDRVLPFDVDAAEEYAAVVASRDRDGMPISALDAEIAAICRSRRATLATRNIKGFQGLGLDVVDPWSDG